MNTITIAQDLGKEGILPVKTQKGMTYVTEQNISARGFLDFLTRRGMEINMRNASRNLLMFLLVVHIVDLKQN